MKMNPNIVRGRPPRVHDNDKLVRDGADEGGSIEALPQVRNAQPVRTLLALQRGRLRAGPCGWRILQRMLIHNTLTIAIAKQQLTFCFILIFQILFIFIFILFRALLFRYFICIFYVFTEIVKHSN